MKKIFMLSLCISIIAMIMVGCKTKNAEEIADDDQGNLVIEDNQENPNDSNANAKVQAPNIIGEVLEVEENGNRILIDSKDTTINGQIWVTITDETNFFENIPEDVAIGYRDVSRNFEVGNYVEIIVNGPVMESYPMQATASAVAVNIKK